MYVCWTHCPITYILSTGCMCNNLLSLVIYWMNLFIDGKCYNVIFLFFYFITSIGDWSFFVPFLSSISQISLSRILSPIVSICFLPINWQTLSSRFIKLSGVGLSTSFNLKGAIYCAIGMSLLKILPTLHIDFFY